MNKHKILFFSLIFSVIQLLSYSELVIPPTFDSLANEINRISLYKQSKALEMIDNLYKVAYNSPDSSLLIAHCIYEESLLNFRQKIVDTTLTIRILNKLDKENLHPCEHALLQFAYGINLLMTEDYSKSFTVILQALETFKHLKFNRFVARTLNYLGNICSEIDLYNLSYHYYSEALLNVTPDFHEFYSIKQSIFRNELFIYNNESFLDSMLFLIKFSEKNGFDEIVPFIYCNLGGYCVFKDPDKAFSYLTKVEFLDYDNLVLKGVLYSNIGRYYRIKKDLSKSYFYINEAKIIMRENNDINNLAKLYDYISMCFEEENMPDSALFYARKHSEIIKQLRSNTIAIETHQKYITNLVETQQKDLLIAKQENELKHRQFIIIIIVSGSIILLILMFLLYLNQQKKRKESENRELLAKAEHEKRELLVKAKHEKRVKYYENRQRKLEKEKQDVLIDAKTREVTSYSLLISNKNTLLKQIKELNSRVYNNKEVMSKIDTIIQESLTIDNEWDNFKLHFDKVHPHFFEKLKQSAISNLTEENLKMCAYTKIGMTIKQIAQLLHIEPRSVVMTRNRITKKLKTSENETLVDFIEKL